MKAYRPPQITLHASMLLIAGVGVLVLGESGVGKSELALALLERHHFLVSDDAVNINVIGKKLIAQPPSKTNHLIHLRSIGIIDPALHFDSSLLCDLSQVDLAIKLTREPFAKKRLQPEIDTFSILNISLPLWPLYQISHCDLALKLETLVKQFKLSNRHLCYHSHPQSATTQTQ